MLNLIQNIKVQGLSAAEYSTNGNSKGKLKCGDSLVQGSLIENVSDPICQNKINNV